jgi:hypothetical protein
VYESSFLLWNFGRYREDLCSAGALRVLHDIEPLGDCIISGFFLAV